jgi:hypothetical protein
LFGNDAFENYSYEFIQMPAEGVGSHEFYYEVETGNRISFEEYQSLNKAFWEEIAKENGITIDDIYKLDKAKTDSEYLGAMLYVANVGKLPAKIGIENDYEIIYVKLSFNGMDTSEDGYNEFHFVVSNQSGSWRIREGLSWNIPDDPNNIDI